jgi:hypothetical protein
MRHAGRVLVFADQPASLKPADPQEIAGLLSRSIHGVELLWHAMVPHWEYSVFDICSRFTPNRTIEQLDANSEDRRWRTMQLRDDPAF